MISRRLIAPIASFVLGGMIIAPFAFQKGRGPAVRVVSITPLGPGHVGGVLPLLVDSKTRDGCIPIVARSITRWIINRDGNLQLIKEPLSNVPLVAYDPAPPHDMVPQYGFDRRKIVPLFLPGGVPDVSDFGRLLIHDKPFVDEHGVHHAIGYTEPWKLETDASPMACGITDLITSLWHPNVIGAYDIPIEILPAVLASSGNPAAAAVQPPDLKITTSKGTP